MSDALSPNSLGDDYGINLQVHEGDFNLNQVKFLVYGESGAGKTMFASTWPNCVFLDIDKGMASITRQVHRINVDSWEDIQKAYQFLKSGDHAFTTVVVDSLNELQYLAMRTIVNKYPNIRRAYDNLPSQSDYGKMLDDYEKMVRHIKGLSMNVIYICNVSAQEFETDTVQPQLVGKSSARNLSRMVDVIGHLYKTEGGDDAKTRVMVFDAVNYVTKDRSGVLPQTMQDPSFDLLYKYWVQRSRSVSED